MKQNYTLICTTLISPFYPMPPYPILFFYFKKAIYGLVSNFQPQNEYGLL